MFIKYKFEEKYMQDLFAAIKSKKKIFEKNDTHQYVFSSKKKNKTHKYFFSKKKTNWHEIR